MVENTDDSTLNANAKWRNYRSIQDIASEYKNRANFSFNSVSKEDVLTEIKVLDASKAIQESDIPVKIINANKNFFAEAICFYFNKSLGNGKFPNCLKLANITLVFKKGQFSIDQLVFSLLLQRYLKGYLVNYFYSSFDNILSRFQCGFRKGYGTQHCLLLMLEIWKGATDNNKAFVALLTDLSKDFDCLSHDLLNAK